MPDVPDSLLEQAQRDRDAMLDEARAEVERQIAAAADEGSREGASQAAHLRDEVAGLEQRMLKEVEGEVVRAAVRVAAELLASEIHAREDAVLDVVSTALHSARNARDVNLRVHPGDAKHLRAHKDRLVAILTRAKDLEIREDRRVKPGGALIETEAGVVDAQLQTQLEEIETLISR